MTQSSNPVIEAIDLFPFNAKVEKLWSYTSMPTCLKVVILNSAQTSVPFYQLQLHASRVVGSNSVIFMHEIQNLNMEVL